MKNAFTVDDYLDHMRQALEDVDVALGSLDRQAYEKDRITQLAVQKAMENIGEAARQCSANYPQYAARETRIPWSALIGYRNRLSHKYFDVDHGIVLNTAKNRLPELRRVLVDIAAEDDEIIREQGIRARHGRDL